MTSVAPLNCYISKTGRRYVDVVDLARIAGLNPLDFDLKFRPAGWAVPRDFVWEHGKLWFAVLSFPQLWDSIDRAGQHDAALLLREWGTAWVGAALAEQERRKNLDAGTTAERSPVSAGESSRHSPSLPEGTPSAMASTPTGGAARVESNYLNTWEAKNQ
jgi:hypothetical protein